MVLLASVLCALCTHSWDTQGFNLGTAVFWIPDGFSVG